MHELELKWMIPMYDRVLLILFYDHTDQRWDVELLRNTAPVLMKSHNPKMQQEDYFVPGAFIHTFEAAIGRSKFTGTMGDIVEIPNDILPLLAKKCAILQWPDPPLLALRKLLEAFLRFTVDPASQEVLKLWIQDMIQSEQTME